MKIKATAMLTVLFVCVSGLVYGEPPATVPPLMEEPFPLFDIGMQKWQLPIESLEIHEFDAFLHKKDKLHPKMVVYQLDSNKIYLISSISLNMDLPKDAAMKKMIVAITSVMKRIQSAVEDNMPKRAYGRHTSGVYTHDGNRIGDNPDVDMENRIELSVIVHCNDGSINCHSGLEDEGDAMFWAVGKFDKSR